VSWSGDAVMEGPVHSHRSFMAFSRRLDVQQA